MSISLCTVTKANAEYPSNFANIKNTGKGFHNQGDSVTIKESNLADYSLKSTLQVISHIVNPTHMAHHTWGVLPADLTSSGPQYSTRANEGSSSGLGSVQA